MVLAEIAREIDEDRETLEKMMSRLGVRKDIFKSTISWGAEKLGRLKLNGQLLGYSPLSRLEELEFLVIGITGKLGLWRALREVFGAGRFAGADLEDLIKRGESQRRRVEAQRRKAAVEALAADG